MAEITMPPQPGDFRGRCLIGECAFDVELLLPSTTYFGLPKSASYLYGTWRDVDGNLLRALRGVHTHESMMRMVFAAEPGGQLERHHRTDELWHGPTAIERHGESCVFTSVGAAEHSAFAFVHEPDGCSWKDGGVLSVSGAAVGPGVHWYNPWPGGGCYSATAKYRTSGTFLGRPVEGFVGHEIHYFPADADWMDSPYGRGREICWQQIANEYSDGSTVQATFAYGTEGWGFAMLHDEHRRFVATTDVTVEAAVRATGYPELIRYQFCDQSWTWRIDPQGERAMLFPGPLRGADGTCTRDGDARAVRYAMGNSDWWTDGRADPIVRTSSGIAHP
jgi:hypothetical protein